MRHVFVESNWVFACCAPKHLRRPTAERLLQRAREGQLTLHLPAICLREGGDAIRKKCQPRIPEELNRFLATARQEGALTPERADTLSRTLEQYRAGVNHELHHLNDVLEAVREAPGVRAFALSDPMLERAIQLRADGVNELKPFDEAILAAILVEARAVGERHGSNADFAMAFCTLDGDLKPWSRDGQRKEPLASLYAQAGLTVYDDFAAVAGAP